MSLNNWKLLDDGKHEKVYSYINGLYDIFIVSKMSTLRMNNVDSIVQALEYDLSTEVIGVERLSARSICIDGILWSFLTYKIDGSSRVSYFNFCFTIKDNVCFLCKSSYSDLKADSVLYREIKGLLNGFDFYPLIVSDSVLYFENGNVTIQPKRPLNLNEHSNSKALFFTDKDTYCVLTLADGNTSELLQSTSRALFSLTDETHRFNLVKSITNGQEKGVSYNYYSVVSGVEIVGSVTVGALQIDNNHCVFMLYYTERESFYDLDSLFDLKVRRNY